ncbi:MAG: phage tail protein [Clostridia bacterium]|nr:phage tail protein [Clostridia bacterium]
MSTRTFYPNNTADIEIPYTTPATTAFEREITWIRPDTDNWIMTGVSLSFVTTNAGYAVTVRHTGGDGIAGYSSTTAGTGVHTFDLPQEAWEELDTDSVTVSVKRPTGNRQTYRDLHIIVTYEARGGDDPQPVSPTPKHVPTTRDHSRVRPVISVMSQWERDFPNSMDALRVGEGILTPTDCVITEEAGGAYQLSLTHPIDPAGKWKLITPFCLIVAPIPRTSTPFIDQSSNTIISAGMEVWAAGSSCGFYSSPYGTRYKEWKNGEGYYPGDRVTHGAWNWECKQITLIEPADGVSAWKKISRTVPVPMEKIPEDELFIASAQDTIGGTEWLTVTRISGVTGYVKVSEAEYQYTADEDDSLLEDIPGRELTVQAFRATDITVDTKAMTVRVEAQHVSYDWSMALVGKAVLKDTPLITAISAIRTAMLPDGASSAPHIYAQDTGVNVTADIRRKPLTNVILDPDEGLVPQAKARLVRDGYDFFLLRNLPGDRIDRGFAVRYGVNLTGVTWRRDYSKIVTRYLPVAKDADGKDYLLPETADETWPYVDSDYRGAYPVDMYQTLQVDAQIGKDDLTEADVQRKMVEEAQTQYAEDQTDLPDTTLTVEFLLLGDTEEYAQYRGLERVCLYDMVTVEHPDLGIHTYSQVRSYEWDAIRCRYRRITLGKVFGTPARTVYGYGIADGEIGLRKLSPEAIEQIRNG